MLDGGHDFILRLEPVFVYADAGLIKQCLRILVDNAIKYTPVGAEKLPLVPAKKMLWLS